MVTGMMRLRCTVSAAASHFRKRSAFFVAPFAPDFSIPKRTSMIVTTLKYIPSWLRLTQRRQASASGALNPEVGLVMEKTSVSRTYIQNNSLVITREG